MRLGDVSTIYGGLTGKNKTDFSDGNAYFVPYKNIFKNMAVDFGQLETVRVLPHEKQNKVRYGDVLFTGSSETPDEVGMSSVVTSHPEGDVYLNSFAFGLRFNDEVQILPAYSKHLFRGKLMRTAISKTASGVTRFNISKARFKNISIPVPPTEEQQRIATILDKFDTLAASLSEGLPKEIELRRRQYEYYRNKLLSFPNHPVTA